MFRAPVIPESHRASDDARLPDHLVVGHSNQRRSYHPSVAGRRRDTFPAAFQYFSTTGEDWRGLLGTHGDNELEPNPLPFIELTTKVARRRHFSKKAGSGSIPAASTIRGNDPPRPRTCVRLRAAPTVHLLRPAGRADAGRRFYPRSSNITSSASGIERYVNSGYPSQRTELAYPTSAGASGHSSFLNATMVRTTLSVHVSPGEVAYLRSIFQLLQRKQCLEDPIRVLTPADPVDLGRGVADGDPVRHLSGHGIIAVRLQEFHEALAVGAAVQVRA
jgi:hypothetical protein